MSGLPGRQHRRVLSEHRSKSLEETKSLDHHLWKCLPSKLRVAAKTFRKETSEPLFLSKASQCIVIKKTLIKYCYEMEVKIPLSTKDKTLNTGKDQSLWTQCRLIQCNLQMKCWKKLVFIMIILKRKSAIRVDKILLGSSFFLREKGSAF